MGALGASVTTDNKSNDVFDSTLFRAHFDHDLDCGMAINQGKVAMINWSSPGQSGLRNAYAYYWIGDPELDVWRGTPWPAYDSISFGTEIVVSVIAIEHYHKPVAGSKVCLYHDGGEYHKVCYADESGKAYFPYPDPGATGTYYLTATNQWEPDYCIVPACTTFEYNGSPPGPQDEPIVDIIEWKLKPITPNLVRSSATVSYSVGGNVGSLEEQHVSLSIFDVSGREVKKLVSEQLTPGHYTTTWAGKDNMNCKCPSGVYFMRMRSNEFIANERIILLR